NAKHYFSSNDADDGDTTYVRLGFKGETQINDQHPLLTYPWIS
ncbi:outer membrane porin protein LC, partial [Escherichia coli HVH 115 (4-4465997)]